MATCIWQNWEEVTVHFGIYFPGYRLFRASCPHYDGQVDSSQNLDQAAVDYLVSQGINRIVSFNSIRYNQAERDRLANANILYRHLPVVDYGAPTTRDLLSAIAFVTQGPQATTLIHCGFGQGRTGTGVSAVQLFGTWGSLGQAYWMRHGINLVETDEQVAILADLRNRYLNAPQP